MYGIHFIICEETGSVMNNARSGYPSEWTGRAKHDEAQQTLKTTLRALDRNC